MAVDMGYVELARLAQSAFDGRRKIEWRINFSLWGGLGIIAYWAMKYHIPIFDSKWTANCAFGVIIFLYIFALYLIACGHRQDKAWKHYYMNKAEGIASLPPISADHHKAMAMAQVRQWQPYCQSQKRKR